MVEKSEYMAAVRAEIDKQLGSTDDDAEAGSWDYAVSTALGVVGPVLDGWDQRLSDVQAEHAKCLEVWDGQRKRLEADRKLLRWLHAEAAWWLQLDRDEHESAEILHMWSKRVAYLEARVGELKNTIGELRAESANRLEVGDRLGWRLVEAQQEIERLRLEVEDLDVRRARWADEHEKRRDDLERSEASRRAWAEEAMRLDTIIHTQIGRFEAQALKADAKIGELPDALTAEACWRNAAKWLKKAVAVEAPGPQCSVHPDRGAVTVTTYRDDSVPDLCGGDQPEVWAESPEDKPGGVA